MLTYNGGECNAVIRGDGSKFVCNNDNLSEKATFNLTFEIPADGYSVPPIVGKLNGTKNIIVSVPKSAPIHKINGKKYVWLTTENVSSVVTFGTGDNDHSFFYKSDSCPQEQTGDVSSSTCRCGRR